MTQPVETVLERAANVPHRYGGYNAVQASSGAQALVQPAGSRKQQAGCFLRTKHQYVFVRSQQHREP